LLINIKERISSNKMNLSLDEIGLKYTFDYGKGKNYTGGDKTSLGHGYTKRYDELFQGIRNNKIKLLDNIIFFYLSLFFVYF